MVVARYSQRPGSNSAWITSTGAGRGRSSRVASTHESGRSRTMRPSSDTCSVSGQAKATLGAWVLPARLRVRSPSMASTTASTRPLPSTGCTGTRALFTLMKKRVPPMVRSCSIRMGLNCGGRSRKKRMEPAAFSAIAWPALKASARALSRSCLAHSSVPTSCALMTPSAMTTTMRPSRLSGR